MKAKALDVINVNLKYRHIYRPNTQSVLGWNRSAEINECDEKSSDPQWNATAPHHMPRCELQLLFVQVVCYLLVQCATCSLKLFYLESQISSLWLRRFWTIPENIPNSLWSISPLITNKHLHSTGLLSSRPQGCLHGVIYCS